MRTKLANNQVLRKRLAEITPLLAIVVILVLPWIFKTTVVYSDEAIIRNEEIAAAIDRAPWIVADRWSGKLVPIPVAALRILRPTAILSRRYRALPLEDGDPLEGVEATLIVVHCSDMRDMQGHYPPVCYPAQGWRPVPQSTRRLSFESTVLGSCELSRYEYVMGGGLDAQLQQIVLNLFIMPNGEVVADLDRLDSMKGRRATSMLGAAQVQLIIDHTLDDDSCMRVLRELVDGMPAMFALLLGDHEELSK